MIRISTAQVCVGFEVREDVTVPELGNFRWLTVGPRDQDEIAIVLMAIPGPPVMDETTRGQVAELTAKGFASAVFLTTDDAVKAYEELSARGAEPASGSLSAPRSAERLRGRSSPQRAAGRRRVTHCPVRGLADTLTQRTPGHPVGPRHLSVTAG